MTIPKNARLSRLAEAASPIEYYPVKRRGQKRRLAPNWDAINWLEDETEGDTEICSKAPLDDGMNRQVTLGWYGAKRRGMYPRRMFDIFVLELSSTNPVAYTPCEACDNYAYTWACTEHPEIPWDTERRVWVRHVSGARRCHCTSCHERRERAAERSSGYTDMGTDELAPRRSTLDALADTSITIEGTFDPGILEIISDTIEASACSVRIEVERDGDTP